VQQRVPLADVTWQAVSRLLDLECETAWNPRGAHWPQAPDRSASPGGVLQQEAGGFTAGAFGAGPEHPQEQASGNRVGPPLGRQALEEAEVLNGRAPVPLFTSPTGERLTRFQAFRAVRRLAAQAGVREVSPHSLRHSYAQIALDGGAAIHDLQSSMAHSDPKTTIAYLTSMGSLDRNPTFVVAREVGE
jgi:integrase